MKKQLIYTFFLILIIGNTHGMITKTRRPITTTMQKTIYPTPRQQQPILIDRLKSYYDQAKNKLSEFWYGTTYTKVTFDETTTLIQKIKSKQPGFAQAFNSFLQKENQTTINSFLNRLVFAEKSINDLNEYAYWLHFGFNMGIKINAKIAHKIINWTKENILQLFLLDLPINNNFFLINLLEMDYKLDQELFSIIHDNLDYIQQKPTGKKFLTLIQTQHRKLYDAIIARKQGIKSLLKESSEQSLKELRSKE